jgi:hypothetical protein
MPFLAQALKSLPYYVPPSEVGGGLKRKQLIRPPSGFAFVAPLNQSFIRDPRLMPGTTRMVCLLAGWGGNGRPIDTTLSAIGRNLGRSARQVQRYLRDAAEEGYLYFRKITNRMGYVIGLRIVLCKAAIYKEPRPRREAKHQPQNGGKPDTTQVSDINPTIHIVLDRSDPLDQKLASLGEHLGIPIRGG